MGWNQETVEKRIKNKDFKSSEIEITELTKEMDFSNLGKKEVKNCENCTHTYVDISNFNEVATNCGNDIEKQKKVIRALSVAHKVLNQMIKDQSSEVMQLQSSRTHIINYRPYNDNEKLVINSITSAISYITYLYEIFNPSFEEIENFRCSIGIAYGKSLITNVGSDGKREVISLGICANDGAKILNGNGNISITQKTYQLLPNDLKNIFEETKHKGKTIYRASSVRWSKYPDLKSKYGSDYNEKALKNLTNDYKESLPLKEIEVTGVREKINFDELSERNVKRFDGLVIFADLDGFSKYIEDATKNEKIKDIIRVIHGIIAEFQSAVQDFDAIPVQVRGDCLISIAHLPADQDSEEARIKKAIQAAIALQSSMELLNSYFTDYPELKVAIGIDYGQVIATRIGKNGEKEKVILGIPALESELLQQHFCKGEEIAISKKVYDKLTFEPIKKHFTKTNEGHYSTKKLTFKKLDEDLKKASESKNRTSTIDSGKITVGIGSATNQAHAYVNQARHCWENGHDN